MAPVAAFTWLYAASTAQVLTLARPVVVPSCVVRPPRSRAFSVISKPSHWLLRSAPRSFSRIKKDCGATARAAGVGRYLVIG